jgi:HSP20 family protein
MFGINRRAPYQDVFDFQRDLDRLFNQLWTNLPGGSSGGPATTLQVNSTDDGWQIAVPLPGIDPEHVMLEAAGNTLTIRAEEPGTQGRQAGQVRYQQSFSVPQFLDLDKLSASHRHGMLQLTIPVKESVKPRQIPIETAEAQRQIADAVTK